MARRTRSLHPNHSSASSRTCHYKQLRLRPGCGKYAVQYLVIRHSECPIIQGLREHIGPQDRLWQKLDPYIQYIYIIGTPIENGSHPWPFFDPDDSLSWFEDYLKARAPRFGLNGYLIPNLVQVIFNGYWCLNDTLIRILMSPSLRLLRLPLAWFPVCHLLPKTGVVIHDTDPIRSGHMPGSLGCQ